MPEVTVITRGVHTIWRTSEDQDTGLRVFDYYVWDFDDGVAIELLATIKEITRNAFLLYCPKLAINRIITNKEKTLTQLKEFIEEVLDDS